MTKASRHGYRIAFAGEAGEEQRVMVDGRDFHLRESSLCDGLTSSLPVRERDLLRIASGVYVADRMLRRKHASRRVRLHVEVADFDFWRAIRVRPLIEDALQQMSDDVWDLTFRPGRPSPAGQYLPFPHEVERVCLYSGGLDSAAGLASRLSAGAMPMLTVTACHQAGQARRVRDQIHTMAQRYRAHVFPLVPRVAMIRPPPMKQQETSQRCRAFLFAALGGVVASRVGAPEVEVYGNGVGALNLLFMTGMLFGSRTTKGSHPQFLRAMSSLLSCICGKGIDLVLPFKHTTKGELVRRLLGDGLEKLAQDTISCAQYPIRTTGRIQECGWCPSCIGRRQSMIEAGINEDPEAYQYDLFGPAASVNAVPDKALGFLKAHLMQLAELKELRDDGRKPDILGRHLSWTKLLAQRESVRPWVDLLRRYREEWLRLVALGHRMGWRWATWYSPRVPAA